MAQGWWTASTTEQKLAQIDGAIAVGMTSKQCGMNLRLPSESNNAMRQWALRHGRHFKGDTPKKIKAVASSKMWVTRHREAGFPEASSKDAYDIFDRGPQSQNLFAAHPYDGEEFG